MSDESSGGSPKWSRSILPGEIDPARSRFVDEVLAKLAARRREQQAALVQARACNSSKGGKPIGQLRLAVDTVPGRVY